MRQHKLCSLLLGIGLSYSVPLTMILESIFLDVTPRANQLLGVVLFAVAFVAIYRDMHDPRLLKADRFELRPESPEKQLETGV